MATKSSFVADFGPKLPGRTKVGSLASFRKTFTKVGRASMAQIIKRYSDLIKSLEEATPTILFNAMQPVYNRSQVYVPKKTGALSDSAQLLSGTNEQGRPMVSLVYGNEEAPYAAIVHEMVGLNHASPTRSKYLQSAMEEEFDAFITSVAIDYAMVIGL